MKTRRAASDIDAAPCFFALLSVGLPGFEPGKTEPKPVVLPLHHSPIIRCFLLKSGAKIVLSRELSKKNAKKIHLRHGLHGLHRFQNHINEWFFPCNPCNPRLKYLTLQSPNNSSSYHVARAGICRSTGRPW